MTVISKRAAAARQLAVAMLLLWAPALAAQVSVTASINPNEILIGDQLMLNIQVYYQSGAVVKSVGYDLLKELPEIEMLQADRFEKDNGEQGKLLELQIRLTSFDSGYYRLPPLPVIYQIGERQDTAYTPELGLLVNTLPISGDDQQLMPIKDIISEPLSFQDLLPWLIGLAVLLAIVLILLSLRRRKVLPPPPPPLLLPAHQLALQELEQLEKQKLWQKGLVKEYYIGLTHALRQYLGWRYQVSALELTTEEAVQQLGQAGLEGEGQQRLRRLLESADLVKFAKAQPAAAYHTEALEQARNFIQETQDEACQVEVQQYAEGWVSATLPEQDAPAGGNNSAESHKL